MKTLKLNNAQMAAFNFFFAGSVASKNRSEVMIISEMFDIMKPHLEANALSRDLIIKKYGDLLADEAISEEEAINKRTDDLLVVEESRVEIDFTLEVFAFVEYMFDEIVFGYKNQDGKLGIQGEFNNELVKAIIKAIESISTSNDLGDEEEDSLVAA
jgi:hypothetical protein